MSDITARTNCADIISSTNYADITATSNCADITARSICFKQIVLILQEDHSLFHLQVFKKIFKCCNNGQYPVIAKILTFLKWTCPPFFL